MEHEQKKNIKICLYLEFYHFWGGILYKKVGTGLLSSYRNQKKILDTADILYTEKWDSSCDILQINTPWVWSLVLIKRARRQNKKVIIWSHVTAEDIKGVFRFSFLLSSVAKKYLTYAYGLADIVFAPTEYTKSLVMAYGLPSEKIIVMSNGVDVEMFQFDEQKRNEIRMQYGLFGIISGTVGLAIPRKGMNTFIFLAKKFAEQKFIWFGKIYSTLVAPSIPKSLPPNFQFTGFVSDIVGAFSALDIFIFPSYEENEGMAILEAGAMSLPLIIRDIPVYRGWLIDGQNCLKAKNDEEFAACLLKLEKDEVLRKKIGTQANMLAQTHSLKAMGAKTEEVYYTMK